MKILATLVTAILATRAFVSTAAQTAAAPVGQPHVYKKADGRALRLYVVKPPGWARTDHRPAIVWFHGGGWVHGSPGQFDFQADYFARRGVVSVLVAYRLLKPRTTTPPIVCIEDAQSAMRWVRSHAKELGIDPHRIAAGGGSAGGHLAAFVGLMHGFDDPQDDKAVSPRADALILFNPVFNNGPGQWGHERVGDRYREFSPAQNISTNAPPTIVFLGTHDQFVPVATVKAFQTGMKQCGVRCEAFFYEGQRHGFFNHEPWRSRTLAEADKFLVSLGWLKASTAAAGTRAQ